MSGSAWLSPAATTTLQCVEGKKSFRPCPFPAGVFTSAVCIKTAEEKQAREKSYNSVQHALRNPFGKEKAINHERNNYESTDSVQKNINSATSDRTNVRRARVAHGRACERRD